MGLGETAVKFTPEEDPSTSNEGGLSRVGISSRATMRQGVDQPCWILGSGGCRLALPSPSPPAHGATSLGGMGGNKKMEEDTGGVWSAPSSPRRRRRGAPSTLRLQWAAAGGGGGGGGGGPCRGGMGGLAGRERAEGGQLVRQERRGVDKGSDGRLLIPPVMREGHPEPAIDEWGA